MGGNVAHGGAFRGNGKYRVFNLVVLMVGLVIGTLALIGLAVVSH